MTNKAYDSAVRMLARREHGRQELLTKLKAKGFATTECEEALEKCQRLGLQSDSRYVESLARTRIRQGYGPQRIRSELQNIGVDMNLVEELLEQEAPNWIEHARAVWEKKYSCKEEQDFAALQKQKQFLYYRGFKQDQIAMLFKQLNDEIL